GGTPGGCRAPERPRTPPAVRPGARAAAARQIAASGRRGACAAAEHAPHYLGWLVDARVHPRVGRALPGCQHWHGAGPAAAAAPVRGLRRLAAALAAGRAAGGAAGLLAAAARRRADPDTAQRPVATGGADLPRCQPHAASLARADRAAQAAQSRGRRHTVYDVAGGAATAARAPRRPG